MCKSKTPLRHLNILMKSASYAKSFCSGKIGCTNVSINWEFQYFLQIDENSNPNKIGLYLQNFPKPLLVFDSVHEIRIQDNNQIYLLKYLSL